jgi:leucyl-tRNA synthetase
VLENFLILLHPYAPHITEELWHQLGNDSSIIEASYPALDESYLVESSFNYPVSINGKKRTEINIDLNISKEDVEKLVLDNPIVQKWIEGNSFDRIIYKPRQMINVVVKK